MGASRPGCGQIRHQLLSALVDHAVGPIMLNRPSSKARRALIIGVLAVAALTLGVLYSLDAPRVSLDFVEYKRFPADDCYAILRITNRHKSAVQYFTVWDDKPGASPILYREKTLKGWSETLQVPTDGFLGPILEPGQAATLMVPLRSGGAPKLVGTILTAPAGESRLQRDVRLWVFRLKCALKITPTDPFQDRVWCQKILQMPSNTNGETTR